MLSGSPGRAAYSSEFNSAGLLHRRQKHLPGEESRAEHSDSNPLLCCAGGFGNQVDPATVFEFLTIADEHAHEAFALFARNQVVRFGRSLDREAMGNEWLEIDLPVGNKFQERFHVARLGPAYVGDGILVPFLFVLGIVAAGTVRPRDAEVEFLLVISLARNLRPDSADRNNDCFRSSDASGEFDRLATRACGSDDNGVRSAIFGPRLNQRSESFRARGCCVATMLFGDAATLRVEIHSQDDASRCLQHLDGKLAD